MPVAFPGTPPSSRPPSPPRKLWSRSECERLESAGLLDYNRLELIAGELIDTMGKKRPHSISLSLVRDWLTQVFGSLFIQLEAPIDVAPADNPTNEPEPDIAVLARFYTDYPDSNPPASDVRLVVEVSSTTLAFDRTVKAGLYARANIAEFWIVDLISRQLLVHRDPVRGQYRSIAAYGEQESIAPLAASASPFLVRNAFPAAQKL
jgi:Uma2 family endonuclease